MNSNQSNRETWLLAAATQVEQLIFKPAGHDLPKFRCGVGWPTMNRGKVVGQCFPKDSSEDKTYEIFISPKIADPLVVLAIITHELCHAVAGTKAAHKKPFIDVMKAVGMVKKWTECNAGDELAEKLGSISVKLGPYPHATLSIGLKKGKVGSRLIKVQCPECEYIARVTRKWLDEAGGPICPIHKVAFREAEVKQ